MRVRINEQVRLREERFGGVCYIPHRDDFFALDSSSYEVVRRLTPTWQEVPQDYEGAYKALARLGICKTLEPAIQEQAYSGPSFIGNFPDIPTVSEPLVVNCFSTAHCPLKCVYCHADDLMQNFRGDETNRDLKNVVSTANLVPSMVSVITGGDPLTRPERARFLIERLSQQHAIVLDTSGVGDISRLLDTILRYNVHVRVSLDSVRKTNSKLRPFNDSYSGQVPEEFRNPLRTIDACVEANVPLTVQTVISRSNENEELGLLKNELIRHKVKHWVLHVAVKAGLAREIERRRKPGKRGILPSPSVLSRVWEMVKADMQQEGSGASIDIRCTDTDNTPNSVVLINNKGDLYTEGLAHDGKVILYDASSGRPDKIRALWSHIDHFGHARRYLNWNPYFFEHASLEQVCYNLPLPAKEVRNVPSIVEKERKYKVVDGSLLARLVKELGFEQARSDFQRDEYYDTNERAIRNEDNVVRLRITNENGNKFATKGPRFYSKNGNYDRVEIEITAGEAERVRADLAAKGLTVYWILEKRRKVFRSPDGDVTLFVDELPEIGNYLEIETASKMDSTVDRLKTCLGEQETRNYTEIFLEEGKKKGVRVDDLKGMVFESGRH